uniref:Uncharacterized protein n=1 Tax=Aureoumbra lagunensis TaxID=44058 RepID=A0A7S3NK67_9STRA
MRTAAGLLEVVATTLKDSIPFALRRVRGEITVDDMTKASSEDIIQALVLVTSTTPESLALGIIEKILRCCDTMNQILPRIIRGRTPPRTFEQVWMPTDESLIRISYTYARANTRRQRLPAIPATLDGVLVVYGKQQIVETALTTVAWQEGNIWRPTRDAGGIAGFLLKAGPSTRRAKHFPLCKEPTLIMLNYLAMLQFLLLRSCADDDEYPSICIEAQVQQILLSTLSEHPCAHCRSRFPEFKPLIISRKKEDDWHFSSPTNFSMCWACLTWAEQGYFMEKRGDLENHYDGISNFDPSTIRPVLDPYVPWFGSLMPPFTIPLAFSDALRTRRDIQMRQAATAVPAKADLHDEDLENLSSNLAAVEINA